MKIRLIETGNAREDPLAQCWYTQDQQRFTVPLVALPVVASLTPQHHEIEIVDEKIRDINLDQPADLVCMSYKTKDAKRTYRYAAEFKKRGIPVILGGVHATLVPEEAALHADAVVAGDAEGIWPQVMRDFERKQLQKIYQAPKLVPFETAPLPRFDLIQNDRYWVHGLQTSRGCRVGCEFCPIQERFGGKSNHKSVDRVMQEVALVRAIDPNKAILFVDEMFCGGDRKFQTELTRELKRNKVDYGCISDFLVMDTKYVWELADSGCRLMSINMPGSCLPQELKAVKAIQKLGIDVWGFFMFGFSFHDNTVFDRVLDFINQSDMKYMTITVLSPFPNTPMSRRIGGRDGILSTDWDLYDQCHVAYVPERMSAQELKDGFERVWRELDRRLYIRPEGGKAYSSQERAQRTAARYRGALTLGMQKLTDRVLGKVDPPVDLEAVLGKKKVEVSVTNRDIMGGKAA